jgi:hypothetical protein
VKIIFALAALFFAVPAAAQTQLCTEFDEFVEHQTDNGGVVRPLSAEGEQAAVYLYNNTPPISTETFNTVLVVELPNGGAKFWYGNDAALCTSLTIAPEGWRKMREHFIGRAA